MVTHDFLMFLSLKCDHAHLFHSLSLSVSDIDHLNEFDYIRIIMHSESVP